MKTLFLDLASHQGSIACVDDTATQAFQAVDHRMSDDLLMPALESCLAEAGWSYKDLTHIACVTGPGGFTSLRMAVTLANVLADQLKIPVAGVHLSDAYEARVMSDQLTENSEQSPVAWMHSTKKTALFIRTFGIKNSNWNEPTFVELDALLKTDNCKLTSWTGELIPAHREALKDLNLKEAMLKPLAEILPNFLAKLTFEHKQLVPWYGRGW